MKRTKLWILAAAPLALAACATVESPNDPDGNPEPVVVPADTMMVDTTTGIPPSMPADTVIGPPTMPGDTPFVGLSIGR